MKRQSTLAAFVAHALAWGAFLWLALWPNFYRGVQPVPVQVGPGLPGEPSGEAHPFSASLIGVNGIEVIPLLLAPVALTALGVLAADKRLHQWVKPKGGLWLSAILLLLFCAMGYMSIGLFYLPAALATVVAAVIASLSGRSTPPAR